MGVSIDDVHAAARRLRNRIHRTPVVSCQSMDDATGFAVFLKCENLQRAGAFKIRGALNKLLSLTADERRRGVVAFSSGNHAQGVALAAQMTGTTSIICMPSDAPKLKLEATRRYGAEVVFYDRQRDDREAVARALAEKTDRVLVPPYDDYAIMAGQGTAALELFQDVPSLDALLAPVGGGGLMAGCSIVARTLFPGIQILGVETDTAHDTHLSLRKGERVTIPPPPTIADGIRITTPGALTFPVLKANVNDVVLVSDDEVREAVRFLALRAHLVTEPTGAVAAAAVLSRRLPLPAGARGGGVLSPVHAVARDERSGHRARGGAVGGEAEVHEGAEMVGRHLAPGLGREPLRPGDAGGEAVGRDEGGDPAVPQSPRAAYGRLAVAADPGGHRLLDGLGQHRDLVEPPELALERHLVLAPAAAHDGQRLVGAPPALLERHAGGMELALLLDADAEGRQHAAAREVVDHRDLTRRRDRVAERRDEDARAELQPPRARGDGGQRGHRLGDRLGGGQALGEPERVDLGRLAQVDELPEEPGAVRTRRPRPRHDADAILDLHCAHSTIFVE